MVILKWFSKKILFGLLLLVLASQLVFLAIIRINRGSFQEYQYIPECVCFRKYLWPPSPSQQPLNSTCSDEGTSYKLNQNVVSFSLFISESSKNLKEISSFYEKGINLNLLAIRQFYPNFTMRIYTDTLLKSNFCQIVCSNRDLFWCDIRKTPLLGDQSQMVFSTWRFLTLGDPTVNVSLSRDLDSIVTSRESAAVQDWLHLPEKKAFHLMRDKYAAHHYPMLAGMWGSINSFLGTEEAAKLQRNITIESSFKRRKANDQSILYKAIFLPRAKDIVAHDSYHCDIWKNSTMIRPFPTKRQNVDENSTTNDFVGNVGFGTAKYNFIPCPVECRPAYGKDWEFC